MTKPVIFILPDNLAPYQISRFNRLIGLNVDFEVIVIPVQQHGRPWSDDYLVPEFPILSMSFSQAACYLSKKGPGLLLVYGYISVMRSLILRCKVNGWRTGAFIDVHHSGRPNVLKEFAKSIFLRFFVDFFIVPGSLQKQYINKLCGTSVDVSICPLVQEGAAYTSSFDDDNNTVLFVGRFSEEKNLRLMLEAYRRYHEEGGKFSLTLVGEGPLRAELEQFVFENNIDDVVTMEPWMNQIELSKVYKKAVGFVLPSIFEPWGVVISEAVQYGLPVIVSTNVGCRFILAQDSINGISFKHDDSQALTHALFKLEDDKLRSAMSVESYRISEMYSPSRVASDLACVIVNQRNLV